MDIAAVNLLPYEDFVNIFGNVVEKCPIIPAAVWSRRPFVSVKAFEAAISEFIDALPESGETFKTFLELFYLFSCSTFAKCAYLHSSSSNRVITMCPGKEGILRCHPDLAGRDLKSGTLTRESQEEQAGAGMDALSSSEAARMARLNEEYKKRFGFPFVICARMNDKAAILQQLSARCQNELAVERARGIEEVKKICHLRINTLLLSDGTFKL